MCTCTATGMLKTARWLINSDLKGTLVKMKDSNGDTAAHDAADNGWVWERDEGRLWEGGK